MFVPHPPNSYVVILTPEDDGTRRYLGHESGAFMNGINALINKRDSHRVP